MSQVSRGAMKWSGLIGMAQLNRHLPSASFFTPKLFSTDAAEPSLDSSDGPAYGKLVNMTKHTVKSDVINLLEGCNLIPDKVKIEYNRSYLPLSIMVEFPSLSSYNAALKILRRDRLYNMQRADKADWDTVAPYDGKMIVLHGIPRNALPDDIERFLSGSQYDSSSLAIFIRPTNRGPVRMASARFPSQALAMHAYITKNRGFCLNNQINVQVLY